MNKAANQYNNVFKRYTLAEPTTRRMARHINSKNETIKKYIFKSH